MSLWVEVFERRRLRRKGDGTDSLFLDYAIALRLKQTTMVVKRITSETSPGAREQAMLIANELSLLLETPVVVTKYKDAVQEVDGRVSYVEPKQRAVTG